tara:strand:- start:1051 stop:2610 length:1560 start_codon:yes stop_codon:yes gene_type:complete
MSQYPDFPEGFELPNHWAGGVDPWGGSSVMDMFQGASAADWGNLNVAEQDRYNRFREGFGLGGQALQDFMGSAQDALGGYEDKLGYLRDAPGIAARTLGQMGGDYTEGIADANAQMMNQFSEVMGDFTEKFESMLGQGQEATSEYEEKFGGLFGGMADKFAGIGESARETGQLAFEDLQGYAQILTNFSNRAMEMAEGFGENMEDWVNKNTDKVEKWTRKAADWAGNAAQTIEAAKDNFALKTTAQQQALKAAHDSELRDRKQQINAADLPEQVKQSLLNKTDWEAAESYAAIGSKIANDHAMANFQVANEVAKVQLNAGSVVNQANAALTNIVGAGMSAMSYSQMNTTNMVGTAGKLAIAGAETAQQAHAFKMKGEEMALQAAQLELKSIMEQEDAAFNALSLQNDLMKLETSWISNQQSIQANAVMASHEALTNAQARAFEAQASGFADTFMASLNLWGQGQGNILQGELGVAGTMLQGFNSLIDYLNTYQASPISQTDSVLGMSWFEQIMHQLYNQ